MNYNHYLSIEIPSGIYFNCDMSFVGFPSDEKNIKELYEILTCMPKYFFNPKEFETWLSPSFFENENFEEDNIEQIVIYFFSIDEGEDNHLLQGQPSLYIRLKGCRSLSNDELEQLRNQLLDIHPQKDQEVVKECLSVEQSLDEEGSSSHIGLCYLIKTLHGKEQELITF